MERRSNSKTRNLYGLYAFGLNVLILKNSAEFPNSLVVDGEGIILKTELNRAVLCLDLLDFTYNIFGGPGSGCPFPHSR